MDKYALLREALISQGVLCSRELYEAPIAPRDIVTLAHTIDYYDAVVNGSLSPQNIRRIGIPWSPELVKRIMASIGGAISAGRDALSSGISGNLSGGTHHAQADRGQGFCYLNDIAVVIKHFLQTNQIKKAAIVDLDAHQGNGNSSILGGLPEVFILSIHGGKSFPYHKVPSTLDISLSEYAIDKEYLPLLRKALPEVLSFQPDILFYIAGVDPLINDRFGKLALSIEGLAERDHLVISSCKNESIPISLALGGGYAVPIEKTIQAHVQTYKIAKQVF